MSRMSDLYAGIVEPLVEQGITRDDAEDAADAVIQDDAKCWSGLADCGRPMYLFTVGPSGKVVHICDHCCAEWRAHPEDGMCWKVSLYYVEQWNDVRQRIRA